MNWKTFSGVVTSKIGREIFIAQKNSPALLFGAGVVGIVATAVLASRATLKLEPVLDETQKNVEIAKNLCEDESHPEYGVQDCQRDLVVLYIRAAVKIAKLYSPAIISGAAAIGFLAGSNRILTRRNAALTAAYATLDKAFRQYRTRVIEEYGPEKDFELRHGIVTEQITTTGEDGKKSKEVVKRIGDPNSISVYARFFDETSRSWNRNPNYNLVFLKSQQNYLNDLLRARGHVFLNEAYDALGLERTSAGAVVGWMLSSDGEGDNFIDFGMYADRPAVRDFINGNEPSILLDFNVDGMIWDKI